MTGKHVEPGVETVALAQHEAGAVLEAVLPLEALGGSQGERERRVIDHLDLVVGQGGPRSLRAPLPGVASTRTSECRTEG